MVCIIKAMAFPGVVHRCNSWIIHKAECQRIDAFELWCWRRLKSPLDSKENKPVNPKGNQPWIFIGRIDAEAEVPILWPPDAKSQLIGKDLNARKDWRQKENSAAEDEIVRQHQQLLNGQEFEQPLGGSEGSGSPSCCSPSGHKESDTI